MRNNSFYSEETDSASWCSLQQDILGKPMPMPTNRHVDRTVLIQ